MGVVTQPVCVFEGRTRECWAPNPWKERYDGDVSSYASIRLAFRNDQGKTGTVGVLAMASNEVTTQAHSRLSSVTDPKQGSRHKGSATDSSGFCTKKIHQPESFGQYRTRGTGGNWGNSPLPIWGVSKST